MVVHGVFLMYHWTTGLRGSTSLPEKVQELRWKSRSEGSGWLQKLENSYDVYLESNLSGSMEDSKTLI